MSQNHAIHKNVIPIKCYEIPSELVDFQKIVESATKTGMHAWEYKYFSAYGAQGVFADIPAFKYFG